MPKLYPSVQLIHLQTSRRCGPSGSLTYLHSTAEGPSEELSEAYGIQHAADCGIHNAIITEAKKFRAKLIEFNKARHSQASHEQWVVDEDAAKAMPMMSRFCIGALMCDEDSDDKHIRLIAQKI
ncbi:unnamed protein product [Chrysoparadoxa australica]